MGNSAAKAQPEAHGTDKGDAGVCSNTTQKPVLRSRGDWRGNPKDRMKMLSEMDGTSRT